MNTQKEDFTAHLRPNERNKPKPYEIEMKEQDRIERKRKCN